MNPISKPCYLSKGFVGPLVTAVLFSLRSLGIADINPETVIGFLYQGAEFAGIVVGMAGRALATTRLTLGPASADGDRNDGGGDGGGQVDDDLPFVPDKPAGDLFAGGER